MRVRRFFAPGTTASAAADPGGSGGPPAAVDELVASLGRPSRAAGVMAVEVAAASPDAQPARRGYRRIRRQVDIPADVARANPSTPPPADTAAPWR